MAWHCLARTRPALATFHTPGAVTEKHGVDSHQTDPPTGTFRVLPRLAWPPVPQTLPGGLVPPDVYGVIPNCACIFCALSPQTRTL